MSQPDFKPILFGDDLVRAILCGRKTQTRRVVRPTPPSYINDLHGGELSKRAPYTVLHNETGIILGFGFEDDNDVFYRCPFGQRGTILWVRETWAEVPCSSGCEKYPDGFDPTVASAKQPGAPSHGWRYRATWDKSHSGNWRPSIHMPKDACRLMLEVKDVRVERLNDISEQDAICEGIECNDEHLPGGMERTEPIEEFERLWNSIANPGEKWSDNPYVWVVEFKRCNELIPPNGSLS